MKEHSFCPGMVTAEIFSWLSGNLMP